MRPKTLIARTLCLLLALEPIAMLTAVPASAQQATASAAASQGKARAADLLRSAEKGVGHVIKLARASGGPTLAADSASGKPFWQALKKVNEALERVRRGLELRDDSFHRGLGDALSAANELEVAFSMSGSNGADVGAAVGKLRTAVTVLFESYGKGAKRVAKGGALTAAEKQQLAKLRAHQAELRKKLAEVEARTKKNDEKIKAGLAEIRRHSDRIRDSRDTAADFASAMLFASLIHGLLWGWHWWWGGWGLWAVPYSAVFIDVYYESVDIVDVDYDWAYLDEEVAVDDLDLAVPMDDAEVDALDESLEAGDYAMTNEEIGEISDDGLSDVGTFEALPEDAAVGFPADIADVPVDAPPPPEAALPEPDLPPTDLPENDLPAVEMPAEPMPAEPMPADLPDEPLPTDLVEPMDMPVGEDFGGGDLDLDVGGFD